MIKTRIKFFTNLFSSGGLHFIGVAFSLLNAILLARLIGPEGYGYYTFTLALFLIIEPIAGAGFSTMVTRDIAIKGNQSGDGQDPSKKLGEMIIITLLTAISISLVIAIGAFFLGLLEPPRRTRYLGWVLIVVPASIFVQLTKAILVGEERLQMGQFICQVTRLGLLSLFIVGVYEFYGEYFGPEAMLACLGISGFIAGGIAIKLSKVRIIFPKLNDFSYRRSLQLFTAALPFALITMMQYFNTRLDILMIGFFLEAEDVGLYQISFRAAALVAIPASLISLLLAPRFARLFNQKRIKELRKVFARAQLLVLICSGLVFILLIFAGSWLVKTLFGVAYTASILPLNILIWSQLISAFRAQPSRLMTMSHAEKHIVPTLMIAAVLKIGVNMYLIPAYGISGAAFGTALVGFVTLVILYIQLWRSGVLKSQVT